MSGKFHNPIIRGQLMTIKEAFSQSNLVEKSWPFIKPTQTLLVGDKTPKAGEVDLILIPAVTHRRKAMQRTD